MERFRDAIASGFDECERVHEYLFTRSAASSTYSQQESQGTAELLELELAEVLIMVERLRKGPLPCATVTNESAKYQEIGEAW